MRKYKKRFMVLAFRNTNILINFIGLLTILGTVQKTLIASINQDNPEFTVDGYTSLGITYTVFALSLWLGPSIVSITGPRYGMAFAAVLYTSVYQLKICKIFICLSSLTIQYLYYCVNSFHILCKGNILMSPDMSVDYLTVMVDNILLIIHSLSFCSPT